ncbi:hypothetical protein MBUL_04446 (plasmid) [Methylobacterium bullatum]|uniref:Uncharacterized protein n=1 Tax=Methylobacterium bullatum TaxID=570505 RepID=A0A679JRS6_9HYPH|nr:hypothetical protein MBUL_04446 [Methylobacterium bullatum]
MVDRYDIDLVLAHEPEPETAEYRALLALWNEAPLYRPWWEVGAQISGPVPDLDVSPAQRVAESETRH